MTEPEDPLGAARALIALVIAAALAGVIARMGWIVAHMVFGT